MKIYCKNKNWEIDKYYNIDKVLYFLIDRPKYINYNNNYIWKNEVGGWHRDYDLPAVIYNDGNISWYINDNLHRENNRPAIILKNGIEKYYLNDNFIKIEFVK